MDMIWGEIAQKGGHSQRSSSLRRQVWSAVKRLNTTHYRLLITQNQHVRTHTWESIAQKYSMESMNILYPLPGINLGHQVERLLPWPYRLRYQSLRSFFTLLNILLYVLEAFLVSFNLVLYFYFKGTVSNVGLGWEIDFKVW
jgi:hypothetical protein